jgi:hypothetical protein
MRLIFAFTAIFALFFVLTAESVAAASSAADGTAAECSSLPERPLFSADADLFLGQKKRRYSGGGRVWANLYYGDTTLKPTEGYKIKPNFYGLQVGFDVAQSHGQYSTFFLNVNESKINVGGGSFGIDNYLIGYGKYVYLSGCHYAFTGSIGYDQYEIAIGSVGGKGNGLQTNFFGEFGLDFPLGKWAIKPFYALQYDFLYHGDIGSAPFVMSDWNGHGLNQLFGVRLNWKVTETLELQSRLVWVHEMLDHPPPFYHVRFSPVHGTNTPAIMFYEGNTGRDWAWLGIGVKLECFFNVKAYLDYDALFNERHATHLGSLGLCLGW